MNNFHHNCSNKNQEGTKYYLLRSEQAIGLIYKVKKWGIEERCSTYLTRKEWPNMDNALNRTRIISIAI
jgi:hypothetical protein